MDKQIIRLAWTALGLAFVLILMQMVFSLTREEILDDLYRECLATNERVAKFTEKSYSSMSCYRK